MMILDGPQAAGKSTIAKAIFFFRTVKDDLLKMFLLPNKTSEIISSAKFVLNNKFRQMFGNCSNFELSFEYTPDVKIEISNNQIAISDKICEMLRSININDRQHIYTELEELFQDHQEAVYIPAGRSMLSIFTHQLNYIFAILDDNQKSMLDFCTKNYIERIMKIKPLLSQMQSNNSPKLINELMNSILQGSYQYIDGQERLQLSESDVNININFASSGQQEALWILNLIYYYLSNCKPTCFIIEEPEAHLYPNTQKEIAEFIVCALSKDNDCIVTTHSPYILGAMNNILDVRRIMDKGIDISQLVEQENIPLISNSNDVSAYFIDNGTLLNAMDEETGLIQNELIDGASDKINQLADELFDLEREGDD